jgi:hypothetical protein
MASKHHHWQRQLRVGALVAVAAVSLLAQAPQGQTPSTPGARNDLPNPYKSTENWAKLPEGRTWGSSSSVNIDPDGVSVWVGERCGALPAGPPVNSCLNSNLDPIMKFDATGKLVKSFGAGIVVFPHGMWVDNAGNIWVADGQDNAPRAARGAAPAGGAAPAPPAAPATPAPLAMGPPPGATKGHQIIKFSPDGKVLMTIGKPGGAGSPDYFFQPNDVIVAPNGDVFVSQGHGGGNPRIFRFDSTGKLLKQWGKLGAGPGDLSQPHSLALDSQGRLFVADRTNNRVEIFSQNGDFIAEWKQFGRPSGVYIDKNDTLYVGDSESQSQKPEAYGYNPGVTRGIRIGSAKTGVVTAYIPDPLPQDGKIVSTSPEGVTADKNGVVYGVEVYPVGKLKRHAK